MTIPLNIDRSQLRRDFPSASERTLRALEKLLSITQASTSDPNQDIAAVANSANAISFQNVAAFEFINSLLTDVQAVANTAAANTQQALASISTIDTTQIQQETPLSIDCSQKIGEIYQPDKSINTPVSYRVSGTQVVGPQATGWTAFSGAVVANKAAYTPAASYTVSAAYVQAEVTAIANAVVAANQRLRAIEEAIRTHGLIN